MVEDVDFRLDYCSGEDVGWKVVAVNASDIAAMGGRPAHAVATLCLPPTTKVSFVDDVMTGMAAGAERWGIDLVGGDISGGREIVVSLSLLGAPVGNAPVPRSGASPGEAVCVTGSLGGAAGGLEVLERAMPQDEPPARALIARQLRPTARVQEAAALVDAGVTAMIDLSDGLAVDLGHLTASSSVGCRIEAERIPVDPNLLWLEGQAPDAIDPLTTAITGGEDFELLFTIQPRLVDDVTAHLAELGAAVTRIGATVESGTLIGRDDLTTWRQQGWEHLPDR